MNIVLISYFGRAGYNVSRSLRAIGARVYVVYGTKAASMRLSRSSTPLCRMEVGSDAIAECINRLHGNVGVASVVPADVPSALLLAQMRIQLRPPIYPIPAVAALRVLDNKWDFLRLCEQTGVAVPRTLHLQKIGELDPQKIRCELGYPAIVKPVAAYGQRGISVLHDSHDVDTFRRDLTCHANAYPAGAIVQEYVSGEDWSASVFATDGEIRQHVEWMAPSPLDARLGKSRFTETYFRQNDDLLSMVSRIISETRYSGSCNFDARRNDNGRLLMFECNPRFSGRIVAMRLCGLDLVAAGLPGRGLPVTLPNGTYLPWQGLFTARGWRMLLSGEWKWRNLLADVSEMLQDPLPPILRALSHEESD